DALGCNRASLMLQLPEVLKATEQLVREREAGQASLFGGFAEPAAAAAQISLPEVPEWPLAQKLAGERDTLGHYLSGHPLDPYRSELKALVGTDLGQLDALWESGSSARKGGNGNGEGGRGGWRQEVTAIVAGQVTGIRKRGESQAFVVLEDGRGRIECAFFSEAWIENAQLLGSGRIVVVEGGLREDEFSGGFSLRARRAWDFHDVCNQAARRLSLRLDLAVPRTLERVEDLLAGNRPGPTPLRLDLLLPAGAAGTLELNGSHSVRVDPDLVDRLRSAEGVRTVHVAMGSRPWATG